LRITEAPNRLRIIPDKVSRQQILKLLPYPGFPTDMQAQFMALLTLSQGDSLITETVFENRLRHGRVESQGRHSRQRKQCDRPSDIVRAPVVATDLRASAALVLAALAAKGKTTIQGLHHLDRGYDQLETKLLSLGARLQRVPKSADAYSSSTSNPSSSKRLIDCKWLQET